MNRVLFRQPGLFAQLRRQNGGLMAAHYHSVVIHDWGWEIWRKPNITVFLISRL